MSTVFTVNVKDAITLMPSGIYLTEITGTEVKTGPSGHPYVSLTLNVLHDEEGDTTFADRRLWGNVSFSPNAAPFLSQFLMAIGHTREELEEGDIEVDVETWDSLDVYVYVGVTSNPNTGEDQNSVEKFVVMVEAPEEDDDDIEEVFSVTDFDEVEAGEEVEAAAADVAEEKGGKKGKGKK